MSDENKPVIEFPTRFPIKVMGERHEDFAATMLTVVQAHAPETTEVDITVRESSNGRYLSLTITVTATSQEQLDNVYRAVTGHPLALYVL